MAHRLMRECGDDCSAAEAKRSRLSRDSSLLLIVPRQLAFSDFFWTGRQTDRQTDRRRQVSPRAPPERVWIPAMVLRCSARTAPPVPIGRLISERTFALRVRGLLFLSLYTTLLQ